MAIIIVLALWAGIIIWVASSAQRRGRSAVGWGLLAAVFGLLAFIPLLIAGHTPEKILEIAQDRQAELNAPTATRQLKDLAELRDAGAITSEEYEAKKATLLERI